MTKESVSIKDPAMDYLPDAGRARHVRRWLEDKLKRWAGGGLFGGLGTMLLALPAFAQASSDQLAEFQFVESIPGVRSVRQLPNGDVQLKLIDGRVVIVAAEDVQILENGAIMVADDAAAQIAQFAAAAEAGAAAATAGSVSGTGIALGGLGLAGAAAAAGGGGGGGGDSDDADPEPSTPETAGPTVTSPPVVPPEPSFPA